MASFGARSAIYFPTVTHREDENYTILIINGV